MKMGPRQRFRIDRAKQQLHWWHSFARIDGRRWTIKSHISARVCAPAVPRDLWGTDDGRYQDKLLILLHFWWAHKGSNLGPLPCEGNALPLSYAPGRSKRGPIRAAIYEAAGA